MIELLDPRVAGAATVVALIAAVGAGAIKGYDYLANEGEASALCAEFAQRSAGIEGSPQNQAELTTDACDYFGRGELMPYAANIETFGLANAFGLQAWKIDDPAKRGIDVDLGTSRGAAIAKGVANYMTERLVDTRAIIDNRNAETGPVFVYDDLEESGLDILMSWAQEQGYETPQDLPEGFIIVAEHKGKMGVIVDPDGEQLKKSAYADVIEDSAWNPELEDKGVVRGVLDLIRN